LISETFVSRMIAIYGGFKQANGLGKGKSPRFTRELVY
jgi:hypothetical protein